MTYPEHFIDVEAVGVPVRIRFADELPESTRGRIRDAWADATTTADSPCAEILAATDDTVETLMERLSIQTTLEALDRQRGALLMFHAAGIAAADGRVIAFIGASGKGKTTLCRALASDFGYVSDETVGVAEDLTVLPYRKPLSVVRVGMPKEQIAPSRAGLSAPPAEPLKLAGLVLLDRRDGVVTPLLERVPMIEAITEIVPQTSYLRDVQRPLQRLARVCDDAGGVWRLVYGEAAALVPLAQEILDAPPVAGDEWSPLSGHRPGTDGVEDADFMTAPVDDALESRGFVAVFSGGLVRVLGGIAPTIWAAVHEGCSREDIVSRVVERHGAPPSGDARERVESALDELVYAGLLSAVGGRE